MNVTVLTGRLMATLTVLAFTATSALAADLFDRHDRGSMKDAPPERARPECSANVALTTDYVFRGFSQTDEGPAIQGGFDCSYSMFYVGVWASNIDFNDGSEADIEIDVYGGIKWKWSNVEFDLGVIYYAYPSANDDGAELDYVEGKFGVSTDITEGVGVSGTVYYSDDYIGETGEIVAVEGGLSIALGNWGFISPTATGLIGYLDFDDDTMGTDYAYWNAGIEFAMPGYDKINWDLRYHDTDVDGDNSESRFVATVSSSW